MPTIFQKLNLKDQKQILVLNAPKSFEPELQSLKDVEVVRDLDNGNTVDFALIFVVQKSYLDDVSAKLAATAQGDAILWFAYPKGTSKNLKVDFNRDNGWEVITVAGFQPVRMVAIDEDWSALRFRRSLFVKK